MRSPPVSASPLRLVPPPRASAPTAAWFALFCFALGWALPSGAAQPQAGPPTGPVVWEYGLAGFTEADYTEAVDRVLSDYERALGRRLTPGARGRVGLKIYTDSGPGLATPHALVKAVINALERRGYRREDIFLVGLNQLRLRLTGYLPSLGSGRSTFRDQQVYVLESGKFYDPLWFYDSPLPERYEPIILVDRTSAADRRDSLEADRKSFLATPLFLDADFWINLPAYTDHPVLGINGSLVNATLWNASNTQRFFRSPANAPAAVAEMAAIPELREGWILNLVSLERYQFIGGPLFNSLYTVSEPRLWASADPVILDALMLERINRHRLEAGFRRLPDDRRLLEFAEQLGVGTPDTSSVQWRRFGLAR